jgi:AmiR/NasT family two-component response regulator
VTYLDEHGSDRWLIRALTAHTRDVTAVIKTDITHAILKDIRELNVVVLHPQDQDGEKIGGQLQRLGCKYETFWPELDALPSGTDLVILAVRPETLSLKYSWMGRPSSPPLIPVVTFENPITVTAVLQLEAFATIASPVRSAGLLTAIAVTISQHRARRGLERYVERMEQKQAHSRIIEQATKIVMESRRIDQGDAYKLMRSQAMLKRESIEVIANAIVKAKELLNF